MDKLPMETIDKLFACLEQFYGERWTKQFNAHNLNFQKTMWQSALYGCTYDQIRAVLVYLKRAAQHSNATPPHQLEFFRYIKTNTKPVIDYTVTDTSERSDFAKKALDEINDKLRFRKPDQVLRETLRG